MPLFKFEVFAMSYATEESGVDLVIMSHAGDLNADTSIGYNVGSKSVGASRGPCGCVESELVGVDHAADI